MEVKILSNTLKSDEIYILLEEEFNKKNISLLINKEPESSKALDPEIIVALIQVGGFAVSLLINTIVTIWATKRKDKEATIKIKYTESKDGNSLETEFPVNLPKSELDMYIDKIKDKTIKKVIIYEK